jgi:hypothetical protein
MAFNPEFAMKIFHFYMEKVEFSAFQWSVFAIYPCQDLMITPSFMDHMDWGLRDSGPKKMKYMLSHIQRKLAL